MDAYLGEIRLFAGDFAPKGWAFCDGALLSIAENTPLYSLLGQTYDGGDGQTTFALPDLRDRLPVHVGDGVRLGGYGGASSQPFTHAHLPPHRHFLMASKEEATDESPRDKVLGMTPTTHVYYAPMKVTGGGGSTPQVMNTRAIQPSGNPQPYKVPLAMPTVALAYIICTGAGEFPVE